VARPTGWPGPKDKRDCIFQPVPPLACGTGNKNPLPVSPTHRATLLRHSRRIHGGRRRKTENGVCPPDLATTLKSRDGFGPASLTLPSESRYASSLLFQPDIPRTRETCPHVRRNRSPLHLVEPLGFASRTGNSSGPASTTGPTCSSISTRISPRCAPGFHRRGWSISAPTGPGRFTISSSGG